MLTTADAPDRRRPWALATLPPFPATALRILETLSKDDVNVRDVVEWVQTDPAFAAELLRVANSALYGFSYQIQSVHHATVTLGLEFVKSLAMTVAMRAYVKTALRVPALRRCWRHSLATAVLSKELAQACGVRPEELYTAALLHDVGRIGLLAAYPAEYANVLAVSAEHSFDLLQSERDLFDVDHCEAGEWLAKEWRFPRELVEVAAHHHDEPAPGAPLLTLVSLACRMADTLDFGAIRAHKTWTLEEIREHLPEHARSGVRFDLDALKSAVTARIETLN